MIGDRGEDASAAMAESTEDRKARHLDVCLHEDVASRLDAGWGAVRLHHEALPEFALADVDVATAFLGLPLRAPLLISSMTGGTERARRINLRLAAAAEAAGIAFALGSGRAMLEDEALRPTFAVRAVAPEVVLFANLGAVQLNYGIGVDGARRLVEELGANGLYLHLDPLQEALQAGGDTNFRALAPKIAALCAGLGVPVIAKSVGSGIAPSTAARLLACGVAAIDVAGAGGTSWALAEGKRAEDPARERIAQAFGDWGYATPRATAAAARGAAGHAAGRQRRHPRRRPRRQGARAGRRPGRPGAPLPARRGRVRGRGRRADRRACHRPADRPLRDRLAHRRRPARRPALM